MLVDDDVKIIFDQNSESLFYINFLKGKGELQSFIETYVAPVTSAMVDHKRRYTVDGAFLVRQIETVYFCLCFPNLMSQTFFANGLPIVPFFSALLVTPYI